MVTEVTTRSIYPYTATALVVVTFPDGSRAAGTGAMVGINDLLTATHVVYNPDRGGWASSLSIYPGADFNGIISRIEDAPFVLDSFRWQSHGWPDQAFTDGSNTTFRYDESQYDVAVIGLSKAIGAQTGWFGLSPGVDAAQSASILGYASGAPGLMSGKAWVTRDAWASVYIATDGPGTDLLGAGSSGGPLYVIDSNGMPSIIGVKSAGTAYSNIWADIGLVYDELLTAISANDTLLSGAYLYKGIPDADATAGRTFSISLDADTFRSSNAGEPLVYAATLADGSPLPSWLKFDAATKMFSGMPESADAAGIRVRVTANSTTLATAAGSSPASDEFRIVIGTAGLDYTGGAGNERIAAQSGNDRIDGAGGIDTVMFASKRAAYQINLAASGISVKDSAGAGGADSLFSIERLQFADVSLALDIKGHAGQAFRLYQAAFDRNPDLGGLGAQINGLDSGTSLLQISRNFIDSEEFLLRYGANPSNEAFVTQLYANVLHRAPDAGGYAVQLGALNGGMSRAQLLVNFSESTENYNATIVGIQNGIEYLPFT